MYAIVCRKSSPLLRGPATIFARLAHDCQTGCHDSNRKRLIGTGQTDKVGKGRGQAKGIGMTAWRGMRKAAAGLAALWLALAGAAQAQTSANPVVVELYTSQGCSACPPADEFLAGLAGRADVLALALHVDYWDYLGWQDAFAQPAFTQRQKRYARAAGAKMIYTPQIIVGGIDRVKGLRPDEIVDRIAAHAAQAPRVTLRVKRDSAMVVVDLLADPPLDGGAVVQMVRFDPEQTVRIERGENAGREVVYRNIVTDWTVVAEWPGLAPLRLELAAEGGAPVAVIVQEPGPGAVLAAARID